MRIEDKYWHARRRSAQGLGMYDAWTAFYAVANRGEDAATLLARFGFEKMASTGLIAASDGGGALRATDARDRAGFHGLARDDDPGAVRSSFVV